MTTLTDFLLARIADDEQEIHRLRATVAEDDAWREDDPFPEAGKVDRPLAECEAKRRIIELHLNNESRVVAYRSPRWADAMTDDDRMDWRKAEARCAATESAVRLLTQVYSDHPDFDPVWTP